VRKKNRVVRLGLDRVMQKKEIRFTFKYIRIAPCKTRLVLSQLEGKSYLDAMMILNLMPYAACKPIKKVFRSVFVSLKNRNRYDETSLLVKLTVSNQGPTMRRFRPGARGRAFKIKKTTSHITIVMSEFLR
jgi:large subunit ribosomal protein L22